MLSPTAINTWFKSPRLFYYRYKAGIPIVPSIHLYKGSLIHELIETAFQPDKYVDIRGDTLKRLQQRWNPETDGVILDKKDNHKHRKDAANILKMFGATFNARLKLLMEDEKIGTKDKAWSVLKPKHSEYEIIDNQLRLKGIIDAIETDYSGRTFIIDYKTSHKYKNAVPEDYMRQIRLYALLYSRYFKKLPDYVGINYLRYGETYLVPIDQSIVNKAQTEVELVHNKTQSENINDYPLTGDKYSVAECKQIEKQLKAQEQNQDKDTLSGRRSI